MFEDIAPKAEHHLLIVPKVHMRDSSHIRSFRDFELIEHMIKVAENYCRNTLQRDPENEMQLHFHKPIFTMVKHLHMHVLVGPMTLMGRLQFCRCMSNDPLKFTKSHFK